MTGRGHDAKWGIGTVANFQYDMTVIGRSEIISRETLPSGKIEVLEKRTFDKVYDSVVASDVDFVLALDTLPTKEFSMVMDGTAIAISASLANPLPGIFIVETKDTLVQKLQKIDGKGLRTLLGWIGAEPNEKLEAKMKSIAESRYTKAIGGVRSISGKSYRFEYIQEEDGKPMMVTFKNADGSDVTNEEEQMVLKRVNAFIDYHLAPDKDCAPGSKWTVYASDMQEFFDPFVNGRYCGKITVTRQPNTADGAWHLTMEPSTVKVIADNGTTTGCLGIETGVALMDPQHISLNEAFITGWTKLENISRHHWLFTAKLNGNCRFQARTITTPLK